MTLIKNFLSLIAFLTASFAFAEIPSQVEIVDTQILGPGCKTEDTAVSLSPDFQELSLLFDNHSIELGQGSLNPNLTQIRKDCQIVIRVKVQPGMQFGFNAVDYRGFASIPSSAWGFQRISYLPKGERISSMREVTLKGPFTDNYTQTIEQKPDRIAWTNCNSDYQQIVLYSQIGLAYFPRTTDRTFAQMSIDSTDLALKQDLKISWRRCQRLEPTPAPGTRPEPNPRLPVRPRRYVR